MALLATYTVICYRGTSYERCLETSGGATNPRSAARLCRPEARSLNPANRTSISAARGRRRKAEYVPIA